MNRQKPQGGEMSKKTVDSLNSLGYNQSMSREVKAYLSAIGKKGGSVKSIKKAVAARKNGLLGGKQKKVK